MNARLKRIYARAQGSMAFYFVCKEEEANGMMASREGALSLFFLFKFTLSLSLSCVFFSDSVTLSTIEKLARCQYWKCEGEITEGRGCRK